jgi:malate dehydrogenase (oxaloacetate-decarboxylating)(NADP+)
VAQHPITDWESYTNDLNKRLGLDNQVMRIIGNKARNNPKRIVFAEADNVKILKAAQIVFDDGIGYRSYWVMRTTSGYCRGQQC